MSDIDSLEEIPEMTPDDLEKVFRHLPEPDQAEVTLYGFDYADVFRQAKQLHSDVQLEGSPRATFGIENPTKEKLSEIYRNSHERGMQIPRVDLHRAAWYLSDSRVELTPLGINVRYQGQEPEYVSKLRTEFSGTKVRLRIEVND